MENSSGYEFYFYACRNNPEFPACLSLSAFGVWVQTDDKVEEYAVREDGK